MRLHNPRIVSSCLDVPSAPPVADAASAEEEEEEEPDDDEKLDIVKTTLQNANFFSSTSCLKLATGAHAARYKLTC